MALSQQEAQKMQSRKQWSINHLVTTYTQPQLLQLCKKYEVPDVTIKLTKHQLAKQIVTWTPYFDKENIKTELKSKKPQTPKSDGSSLPLDFGLDSSSEEKSTNINVQEQIQKDQAKNFGVAGILLNGGHTKKKEKELLQKYREQIKQQQKQKKTKGIIEYEQWKRGSRNRVISYSQNCCRNRQNPSQVCQFGKTVTDAITPISCNHRSNGKCIWGIITDVNIRNEIKTVGHMRQASKIKHWNPEEMHKHHYFFSKELEKPGKKLNAQHPRDEEYFMYDRCGNYVSLKFKSHPNLKLFIYKNLISYLHSKPPQHGQLTQNVAANNKGITRVAHSRGSGTLISSDRFISCSHNFVGLLTESDFNQDFKNFFPVNDGTERYALINLNDASYNNMPIDWVIFDKQGLQYHDSDILIAKLSTPINLQQLGNGNNPSNYVMPFGFQTYAVGQYLSYSQYRFKDLRIDTTRNVHDRTNHIAANAQLSTRVAMGRLQHTSDNTFLSDFKERGKRETSGQSGSLCYDEHYNQHSQYPFIDGIYVAASGGDPKAKFGYVAKNDIKRFLWECEMLNEKDRTRQCDTVINAVLQEIDTNIPKQPLCKNFGTGHQVLWNNNANRLECYLEYSGAGACPDLNVADIDTQYTPVGQQNRVIQGVTSARTKDVSHRSAQLKYQACQYQTDLHGMPNNWANNQMVRWDQINYCDIFNGCTRPPSAMVDFNNMYSRGSVDYQSLSVIKPNIDPITAVSFLLLFVVMLFILLLCTICGCVFGYLFGLKIAQRDKMVMDGDSESGVDRTETVI
eukprot:67479_1